MVPFNHGRHTPREAQQLAFVSPKYRLVQLDVDIEEDVVQIDDNVFLSVANDYEEAALFLLCAISDERRYPGVTVNISMRPVSVSQ